VSGVSDPTRSMTARGALRVVLAVGMTAIGTMHFVTPAPFVAIVPRALPYPHALVLISGAFEIAGGLGLLVPRVRRAASFGLVALYLAVFPANVNMAVNDLPLGDSHVPVAALWLRLPLQIVFIAWALWVGREAKAPDR
jgi:uncharacterized membrane protein